MVHAFKALDEYYALDVESGSIVGVDALTYHLLNINPEQVTTLEKARAVLGETYTVEEIQQTIDEITELVDAEVLYTASLEAMITAKGTGVVTNGIKALCLHSAHDCNLRCKYCFASEGDYRMTKELMSLEISKKAIDYLLQNSGTRKNVEVDFFGGEPLMNMDVVRKTVEYGRQVEKQYNKVIHFTITTNAMLLTDDTLTFINDNMDNVVLSLDGRKEVHDAKRPDAGGHGSYDRIVKNIKKFIAIRGDKTYYVRGTFTADNCDFGEDVMHLYGLGFNIISIEPVVGSDQSFHLKPENVPELIEEYERLAVKYLALKQKGEPIRFYHFDVNIYGGPCLQRRLTACGAGNEYFAVAPNGDIYPCHQFVGMDEFKVGNVMGGITERAVCDDMSQITVYSKPACRECWAKYFCSGGCHANAWFTHGDLRKPNTIACDLQKKRIECAIAINSKLDR
jgi:uncharacterized protein